MATRLLAAYPTSIEEDNRILERHVGYEGGVPQRRGALDEMGPVGLAAVHMRRAEKQLLKAVLANIEKRQEELPSLVQSTNASAGEAVFGRVCESCSYLLFSPICLFVILLPDFR
jgi:hypothetical protein